MYIHVFSESISLSLGLFLCVLVLVSVLVSVFCLEELWPLLILLGRGYRLWRASLADKKSFRKSRYSSLGSGVFTTQEAVFTPKLLQQAKEAT